MTISAGYTAAEIREIVHQYELQPHGTKGTWLAEQGISVGKLERWRAAVVKGDLDRGLIPRDGSGMTISSTKRTALERELAKERAARAADREAFEARERELEEINATLGKAIGLLHTLSEHEPDEPRTSSDHSSS